MNLVWGLFLAHTQNVFFYTDPSLIRQRVAELALFFGALAIISFFASIAQFYGMAQMGERIAMKLRSDLFEAVIRREIAFFDDEINAVGVLTTRLVEDSRTVTKATGIAAARQIQAFFTLTIGIILGFTASWKIAFVVLATFPVSIAASAIQMQAIAGQHGTDGSEDLQAGIISSAFTHMRTVAAFSVQFKVRTTTSKSL
jgi:ATP-binding cassette subfamily B (MDR/TAP) protein 1